ncbi:Stk1 family PASTA domain-containing Ser/Thr kinase [Brevibacterium daeguense]|uniref:non-specific serine/threonine protein kinase n=2 Tax=Brevibacterium daeguense TaxID=909936 RepID=A0ABP8EMN7_9MICO
MTLKDPLLGVVLDHRYRVDSVVARGGMAMVYRGTDLRLDREVAIKVMHAHLTADESFVERFRREAINAARLSHPNLVAVHDQGRDGDVVYLVMEYLESVTLRRELRHRGRLTPRQAIVVMDAVLSALEAVHAVGIIHRDLKPDNVLLGTDGQIKLADFGLARSVTNATTTKTLIGTVGYVAPELVTRTGADSRTDLYTLGIMFYEMLTGSQPYTDEVPIQVAYRHVHDTVPAPSEAASGISPLLDAIVLWTTSRNPDDRPESATALRTALAEARTSLTDDELDWGSDQEVPATGQAVLTATIVVDEDPERLEPKEPEARTDEIPYLRGARGAGSGARSDSSGNAGAGSAGAASADSEPADDDEAALGRDDSARRTAGEASESRESRDEETLAANSAGAPPRSSRGSGTRHLSSGATAAHPHRKRKRLTGVVSAAVALGLVGWGFAVGTDPVAEVPGSTVGKDQQDVSRTIADAGFDIRTKEVFNTSVPAGRVVGTEPGPGTELAPDAVVTILVSKGEELFGTPDVTGGSEDEARDAIEAAGLTVGSVSREHSGSVADGVVISQSVGPGDQVTKGTAVDIVVSKGVAPVTVPIVTGLEYDTAFGKLTRLGFLVAKEEVFDDSVEKGRVVSQYPRGKAETSPGELVILKVSKGKEPAQADDKKDAKADDKKDEDKPDDAQAKDES